MDGQLLRNHAILGITPFERPDPELAIALARARALAILDLGHDPGAARLALDAVSRHVPALRFGVRVPHDASLDPQSLPLPPNADVVVVQSTENLDAWRPRRVIVQVCSLEAARTAARAGAAGLIAKGAESGGTVGALSAFILLQQLVGEVDLPIWVQGGVGLHTAAACIAGGATGVVLDSQLALVEESSVPDAIRSAVSGMDGSETSIVGGCRLFTRAGGLPAGQDAAFALPFARRFRTAGGVVRGIERHIASHITDAKRLRPLGPGSPFAEAHRIAYPIAQGPMTRVSDRAPFAHAVSMAGGLPFIALSLMHGEEARTLLRETAAVLGDRPWGVGILGFVPPELRDEQLRLIEETRPSVALIAGGRPSHARSLEAAGIPTYLHVPSPGLLDLFLKDGARRFVFEGSECGGHVGPRSSFVLWESQIERLLQHERPEEVSVLFAGGIHDARSAAMVAALAAPLAARRARVGVLMGTAYLFTEEAVASGAIQPAFQAAALSCLETDLLETAPGHSTRCAASAYSRVFVDEKRRLEHAGLSPQDVWSALEQLNLGRLRIASKGLKREGQRLVPVDADAQSREGMFMIGDAAVLCSRTTTIQALHERVSAGATQHLAALRPREPRAQPADRDHVAIIGIECIFPGAADRDAYWANLINGIDSVTEVPAARWDPGIYFDQALTSGKTNSKWGAFIPTVRFDPAAYGIPPRSVSAVEPVQLLSLEVAKRALADAGYGDRDFDRERTSVIFGVEPGTDLANAYSFRALYPQLVGDLPAALDRALPAPTEDSFPGVLGNVVAGRIANRLDLGGVNYTVDAACASSLAALDVAVKELLSGETDMVLCGGADLHNSINDYLMFSAVHALSPVGRCRAFDADADGLALGEGIAVVVLKRLQDAERDGDRIYAVVRGLGTSSDGRCLSLTAPRKEGQERALDRAYRRSGISPADVGLVEAHGTGTVVGDRTELASLTAVFDAAGARPGSCVLGSVKSQIGHTKCAAGMAGLIKVALSLYHGILPPTLHVDQPNPFYSASASPFSFLNTARPWPVDRRVAGVSSFGFGGTNFHAVLSRHAEATPREAPLAEWPAELFLFRGADPADALRTMQRLEDALAHEPEWRLRDLACTVCTTSDAPVQIALVASSLDDLRSKLRTAADPAHRHRRDIFFANDLQGSTAFLFPGQGSQRPGLLRDLFLTFPQLRPILQLGARWHDVMFPPQCFNEADRARTKAAIDDTRVAQPVLGLANLAMARLLGDFGVEPQMVAGHSYGELSALAFAGAIPASELIDLSEARGQLILAAAGAEPGSMAAVAASADAVERLLDSSRDVVIANRNAPDQTVISGRTQAITDMLTRLQHAGIGARRIPVACAFHSPLVAAAEQTFAQRLERVAVAVPRIPVWSNLDAGIYPADPEGIRKQLAQHLVNPVAFTRQIEAMYEAGARVFVEAGPGDVLSSLVDRILGARPHTTVVCDRTGEPGLRQFQLALAQLAVHGIPVDARRLFEGRGARPIDLSVPPQEARSTVWNVNGQTAWPADHEPPQPVTPLGLTANAPAAAAIDRDAVALEYIQAMRTMVTAQRDVMLKYFGGALPSDVAQPASPVQREVPKQPVQPDAAPVAETLPMSVLQTLRAIVSDRTGYPVEMLDLDLDLEADLGIDSIKRIEILGALGERLNLGVDAGDRRDQLMEELSTRKTLRSVVEWIEARRPVSVPRVARYVVSLEGAAAVETEATRMTGRRIVIADDRRGVAQKLAALLESDGASTRIVDGSDDVRDDVEPIDAFVYLSSLAPEESEHPAKALFEHARQPAFEHVSTILAATGLGGDFGRHQNGHSPVHRGGVAGLLKSIAKERRGLGVRVVDLNPLEDASRLAAYLRAELSIRDRHVEVGYLNGARVAPTLTEAAHAPNGNGSASPLHAESVVLVVGGARGITARVAIELARKYRCRFELVGRSPVPGAENLDPPGWQDLPALRKALLARTPDAAPARIEAECARIRANGECRATLDAIRVSGGTAHYSQQDVRNTTSFEGFIDDLYDRHGRLDVVIYGAGVIEDKLLRQKTRESFDRVFDTKVTGALTIARKLRGDTRAVVFFSSIASAFGSSGQADYAAANDVLDKLAWSLRGRVPGRVVSINWGPWADGGMVSPELQREYARRGLGLIAPDLGVQALIDELSYGSASDAQVILTNADPARL